MAEKKMDEFIEKLANRKKTGKRNRVPANITVDADLYEEAKKYFKGDIGKIVDIALQQALDTHKKKKGA